MSDFIYDKKIMRELDKMTRDRTRDYTGNQVRARSIRLSGCSMIPHARPPGQASTRIPEIKINLRYYIVVER